MQSVPQEEQAVVLLHIQQPWTRWTTMNKGGGDVGGRRTSSRRTGTMLADKLCPADFIFGLYSRKPHQTTPTHFNPDADFPPPSPLRVSGHCTGCQRAQMDAARPRQRPRPPRAQRNGRSEVGWRTSAVYFGYIRVYLNLV